MKNITRCLPIIISMSAALGMSSAAQAKDWTCAGTDFWDNAGCWSPAGLPATLDTAFITQSGASDVIVNYRNVVNPADVLDEIRLDATGAGIVRLEQTINSAISASNLFIGRDGTGEYLQTAGTSNFTNAFIASRSTASGRYDLGGSATALFTGLIVGNVGTGVFAQTGGTNTVADSLIIGAEAGGVGTYTLSGGTLTVGDIVSRVGVVDVGRWGTGSFTQEAGTVNTVYGDLFISRKAGPLGAPSTGTYTMNGGTLNADRIEVGVIPPVVSNTPNTYPNVHEASDGRFVQNGGDVNVSNGLIISNSGGALGRYELRGGSLTASSVLNNDRFEYSGGSLDGSIENHAILAFSGAGTRTVTGSVTNVGETTYTQSNVDLSPPVVVYQETKNGEVRLADGTTVSIGMDLTLGALGTLDLELGSSFFGFDDLTPWISVGGDASIAGILDLTDISGWSPINGDSWTLIRATTLSGLFDQVLFPVLPGWSWELIYGSDKILLTGQVSSVPVPAAVWLFGSGLLGLVGVARRRG
ncbi:hypothetical protein MNBD_GAMMA15-659 [hydrothermal vent metagenome]|uniref:Autotransporter protein n=1 Tax=hydrothermal vent metagenome TaxID=652676 RepID=A0A3B0YY01_9ZZZZ